jgi:hypothetical protein
MLQITDLGIRPHIRINGGWHPWESDDAGLTFNNKLSLDKWYKCKVICENDNITIKIYDGKTIIFNRSWSIPIGALNFVFKKDDADNHPVTIPFSIGLEYGSVGFRNYEREKAFVRNVLIQKL